MVGLCSQRGQLFFEFMSAMDFKMMFSEKGKIMGSEKRSTVAGKGEGTHSESNRKESGVWKLGGG